MVKNKKKCDAAVGPVEVEHAHQPNMPPLLLVYLSCSVCRVLFFHGTHDKQIKVKLASHYIL